MTRPSTPVVVAVLSATNTSSAASRMHPLTRGAGPRLFPVRRGPLTMRLDVARPFVGGAVSSVYRPPARRGRVRT